MPKQIVISELGGPEVLKYQNYDYPKILKIMKLGLSIQPLD